jgi:lantibiotic transport system permease protein
MIGVMIADLIKLRGSLVLLVMAVPPVMMAVLGVLVIISGNAAGDWPRTALSGTAIWAYFLLPMTATGLTALLAQLEHATGVWSHILATGTPRWQIFLSKGLIAFALMAATSLLVGLAIFASGHVGGLVMPAEALEGIPPYGQVASILAKMWVASLLVTAFQLAIALRFSSFALPVSVGIGGTFVAVAATSSQWGLVFPWLMPVNVLASEPERAVMAITIGGMGGLIALAAMILWLSRRDWD